MNGRCYRVDAKCCQEKNNCHLLFEHFPPEQDTRYSILIPESRIFESSSSSEILILGSSLKGGLIFDFIPWKPTDTWPRDRIFPLDFSKYLRAPGSWPSVGWAIQKNLTEDPSQRAVKGIGKILILQPTEGQPHRASRYLLKSSGKIQAKTPQQEVKTTPSHNDWTWWGGPTW